MDDKTLEYMGQGVDKARESELELVSKGLTKQDLKTGMMVKVRVVE